MRRLLLALVAAATLVVVPAAHADTVVVDFESGPPLETAVNDDYLQSAFVRFLHADFGFRPYRRSAPNLARSGSVVADVGVDVCVREAGPGVGCETAVGGTSGRLARTASAVTVHAGLFNPAAQPVTARMIGYRANGSVAATGTATSISHQGFTTPVRVTSSFADIAYFELKIEGNGALGAALGFDDLTIDYPANSLPDFSLTAPTGPVAVLQGKTTDVPVQLTRLNGSSGNVHMSVTGLPTGVTAQVVPTAVAGTGTNATVRLTAGPNAPPFEVPRTFTIVADPRGNGSVGPAERTAGVLMRVGGNFSLQGPAAETEVPTCAAVDVPFKLLRDRAFTGTVALSAEDLPPGVGAEFLPGASIPPGGGFNVDATLRLRGSAAAIAAKEITIRAESAGVPARTIKVKLKPAVPTAELESAVGLTPRHMTPGTQLRLRGNGFCAGTVLRVGNVLAEVPATVDADGRGLAFTVPRLATTGPVTVVPPPGSSEYVTTGSLVIRSVRNRFGFKFLNYGFDKLAIDELTDLVGHDDLFITVNPCWPWGSCSVVTGILDPSAAVVWGVANLSLRAGGGGHCLGMVRGTQEIMGGRVKLNRFTSAGSIWDIPAFAGPGDEELKSFLDSRQALQITAEYIQAFVYRNRRVSFQVGEIERELRAGREPGVVMLDGHLSGHQVRAYDMEPRPDGGVDILVYDPNRPFTLNEDGNAVTHRDREAVESVIRVSPDRERWEYSHASETWTGSGLDGSLFAVPLDWVPKELSLPGLDNIDDVLNMIISGSVDGSARVEKVVEGAEYLPLGDRPGVGGITIAREGSVSQTVVGVKKGRYSQAVVGSGFAASAELPAAPGVRDRVSGSPEDERVRFESLGDAPERPLELTLAKDARSATIQTRTSGADTATLGSTLTYVHEGAPTEFSFSLGTVRRNGGPDSFESGPLKVGRGDRVTAAPDWGRLGRVRLVVRHRGGGVTRRTLRNRAAPRARVKLAAPRLRGRMAVVKARFGALPRQSAGGLVLEVRDGRRTLARRAIAVRNPRKGSRAFRWRVPELAGGRYRLVARLAVSVGGRGAGTVRRISTTRIPKTP
jgi:hypothetical protein